MGLCMYTFDMCVDILYEQAYRHVCGYVYMDICMDMHVDTDVDMGGDTCVDRYMGHACAQICGHGVQICVDA